MAPRSSWKGFLKLSLVSVPVKAYTANATTAEIRLNQLHADCNNRIRYKKTCPEHGEVDNDAIVSGYELGKGQYVVIDVEEIQKLRTESDKSVNIKGFIAPDALDPRYHAGRTYYLLPDGAVGQKPYALLRQSMVDNGVHALAQVVIAGREQLVLLRPMDELLAMTVLSHEAKVKAPGSFYDELNQQELGSDELALTKTLIDASRLADFDYAAYKDEYVEKLTQLIQAKVDGQELVAVPDHEEPKILNLMEALKQSVAAAQASAPAEPATSKGKKKMAPSKARKRAAKSKKTG